jgi:hypothetical protein
MTILRYEIQERRVASGPVGRGEWVATHRQYSMHIDISTTDGVMRMDANAARSFAAALVEMADRIEPATGDA